MTKCTNWGLLFEYVIWILTGIDTLMVYENDLDVLLQMYTQLTQYKCKYEKIVNQKVLCSLLLVDP